MRCTAFLASLMLAAGIFGGGAARAETVDVEIVLAADVSRSIDDEEFKLQRQGYAAAIISPQVLRAIQTGVHGAIGLVSSNGQGPASTPSS